MKKYWKEYDLKSIIGVQNNKCVFNKEEKVKAESEALA